MSGTPGQNVSGCATSGPNTPPGWTNTGVLNSWRGTNSGPPSDAPVITAGTFPATTVGPCDNGFLYVETTGGCGANAIAEGPTWDASGVAQPTVSFAYHLQGVDCGTLSVEAWDGLGWNTIWSITGDQGAGWMLGQASVPTYAGTCSTEANFRFVYVTTSTGELGDCAIDEVAFGEPQNPLTDGFFIVEYQENGPQFGVTIDGKLAANDSCQGLNYRPAAARIGRLDMPLVEISSDVAGRNYDLLINSVPVIRLTQGALSLPDGQIANLDIVADGFTTLSGAPVGQSTLVTPPAGPNGSVDSFPIMNPGISSRLSVQGFAFEASALLGVVLSQATELELADGIFFRGDDSMTPPSVDLTAAPFSIAGGIDFYGVNHTTIYVTGNGRLSFTAADTSTGSSIADFASDVPSIAGFWCDLDQRRGGSILATSPASGLVRFEWTDVPFFGSANAASRNSFYVELDANSGSVTIGGLQGTDPSQPGTGNSDDQLIGISPGDLAPGGAASDPGMAAFALGASGAGSATDMLYFRNDIATSGLTLPAPILNGLDVLIFTPDAMTGGYTWLGQ